MKILLSNAIVLGVIIFSFMGIIRMSIAIYSYYWYHETQVMLEKSGSCPAFHQRMSTRPGVVRLHEKLTGKGW